MSVRFLLVFIFASNWAMAEELPYESFGQMPLIENVRVSPSGNYIAAVLNTEEGPTVVVSDFGSRDINAIVRLKYGEDRVERITWATDERLLLTVSESADRARFNFRVNRLYQIKRDGSGMKQVRRKVGRTYPQWAQGSSTARMLSTLPDDPDHILMQIWEENDKDWAVFKVNLEKNSFDKQFPNTYKVHSWIVNGDGEVVLGLSSYLNENTLWHLPEGEKKWRELHKWEGFEDDTFTPLAVSDGKLIVLSNRETGYESAWEFDIATREFGKLLYGVDGHDLEGALRSNDETRVIGFYHFDHYRVDHYLDQSSAASAQKVKDSLRGYETTVVSRSDDGQRIMVSALRDDAPPKYVWMDLGAPSAGVWYAAYPGLEGQALAPVTPFEFEARDGLRIEGYLTMPVNSQAEKPPLIVFPHGGPRSRDYQYFDPYVQFFANRGYAVLQVNFRGSTGFGSSFEASGYKEWGLAMQEDVYDAVDWLAEKGTVDVDQKCMVGASYGGYVALVAAFQRPNDYRCIVAMAGISDLQAMVKTESLIASNKAYYRRAVGDVSNSDDNAAMEAVSAKNHINKIKAPILLIHGTEDTRVEPAQSRSFYNRAKESDVDIEYMEIDGGTHSFDEYNNRLAVFKKLDEFLDKNL